MPAQLCFRKKNVKIIVTFEDFTSKHMKILIYNLLTKNLDINKTKPITKNIFKLLNFSFYPFKNVDVYNKTKHQHTTFGFCLGSDRILWHRPYLSVPWTVLQVHWNILRSQWRQSNTGEFRGISRYIEISLCI